jgi:hypothetical protein
VTQYKELNANAGKQLCNNEIPQTKALINWTMQTPQREFDTLHNLAESCSMPKSKLQNRIAWYSKRFGNFTGYIEHNQYLSRLHNATYFQ